MLKRLSLLPSDENLLALLHKRFCAVGGNHLRINYRRFLEVCDPFAWPVIPEFKTNRVPNPPPIVPTGVSEVLSRYRQIIKQNRIRIRTFIDDYDHLKHGQVTAHQFEAALGLSGCNPTQQDVAILVEAYKVPRRDTSGQDYIDYESFLKDLNAVFDFEGPNPREVPTITTLNITTNVSPLSYDANRLTEDEYNRVKIVNIE